MDVKVCVGKNIDGREREMETREETGGRDNTGMDSSALTECHIGDTPDIPCREVSVELIRIMKH